MKDSFLFGRCVSQTEGGQDLSWGGIYFVFFCIRYNALATQVFFSSGGSCIVVGYFNKIFLTESETSAKA